MKVLKASLNDLNEIKSIHKIAVKHMNDEHNHNQWLLNDQNFINGIINYINNNQFYIVKDNDEIIGFFAMIYGIDTTYNNINGQWLNKKEYVTIHKIAVKYHRKHIASFILDYVSSQALLNNIYNIRIDTHKDNVSMNSFLNNKGFCKCGIISIKHNFNDLNSLRIAYQKILK